MPSERVQRRIDALLDQTETAIDADDWQLVASKARAVLAIDDANDDAAAFLQMAVANGVGEVAATHRPTAVSIERPANSVIEAVAIVERLEASTLESDPESFAGGRYHVLRFLGEGGKKRVFLAHDALLDRDIAFSLIKSDGLDDIGRERIMREAQAMGRLSHQNIVSIYDIGEHTTSDGSKQPFLVQELMGGGDVEDLLKDAEGALPLQQSLDIALATARGLEFAHAAGVIHRDIKPGNVWLTADGVAKIGDLGLAVTLDQSRLTSHGMMVGTYGYMPPEQALGQEVTAQADLYSLGAMLYELVTGKPPFEGDTPTAVISQHLNTAPVAPSWHSEHCPPDLEALILHLLEKVPEDRPASASEVIAALEVVDPEGHSTSHSDSGANPLDRLARGVFVGREDELDRLRGALDGAIEGRGSVVMLLGEPGVGKTRTVQELETYARMRGAKVYWGRTHESSGMPAYWPWLQVGRAWYATRDLTTTATQAAIQNPELIRLFPELRQLVPGLPEPPPLDETDGAQFMLFDAYTQFMRAQSTEQPWVVVLDDLHWADKPTLQLLQFAARELSNMNVLVVGTYRDTELVRTHPLSETLAELNRGDGFQRIVLKGLDSTDVAAYVQQRTSIEPPHALIDRIYEETEGNPFFLSEVVNLMAEEGTLSSDSVSDIALPDGVREALGRRLDRLSEDANELLQVAAVVGREFAHETLSLMTDHQPDELLRLVEEAINAHVIEEGERPGRYLFTHALMQETLLGELSTTRRVRLHGRVAEVLEERWGDRSTANASLLALHFSESSTLNSTHATKAILYSSLAGDQEMRQAAWSAAIGYYQRAVNALREADADSVERPVDEATLLLSLGICYRNEGAWRDAWRSLATAFELFRVKGDPTGLGRSALATIGINSRPGRHDSLLRGALEQVAGVDQDVEARILTALADGNFGNAMARTEIDHEERARFVERARSLAETRNLRVVTAHLHLLELRTKLEAAIEPDMVRGLSEKLWALQAELDELGSRELANHALGTVHTRGRLIGLVDLWSEGARRTLDHAQTWHLHGQELAARSNLATTRLLRGDYAGFDDLLDGVARGFTALDATRARRWLRTSGVDRALAEAPTVTEAGGVLFTLMWTHSVRAEILLAAGDGDSARQEFEGGMAAAEASGSASGSSTVQQAIRNGLGELIYEFAADDELVNRAYQALQGEDSPLGGGLQLKWLTLGKLALRLNLADQAEQHYRNGLKWCERERCPVEAGRCHQGLADVAERRGDLDATRTHLDAAGELFAQHGAKLYLDQVIAKKEILKA